jgi:2-polyprenyl-3-methyl-5-hydroxy-6-metoxy-1,4-benzoquinol methylase
MTMNEIDRKLHAAIHQGMVDVPPDRIFSPRVRVFDHVESKLGISIRGRVLDVGCGSGYASIWLAKNKPLKRVYALEASEAAVKGLLTRYELGRTSSRRLSPVTRVPSGGYPERHR